MKKRIFLILAMVLTLSFFLASCNFTVDFSGCNGLGSRPSSGTQVGGQITPEEDNSQTAFSLVMVERNSFYYPTFNGLAKFDFYPEVIEVEMDGFFYKITPKTMKCVHGKYIFTFDCELQISSVDKGTHVVSVYGTPVGGERAAIEETFDFISDDEYFWMSGINFASGEVVSGMDKEGNWTPFM